VLPAYWQYRYLRSGFKWRQPNRISQGFTRQWTLTSVVHELPHDPVELGRLLDVRQVGGALDDMQPGTRQVGGDLLGHRGRRAESGRADDDQRRDVEVRQPRSQVDARDAVGTACVAVERRRPDQLRDAFDGGRLLLPERRF
jgi:hypothetical protein